jgi:hypothetical protein
MIRFTIIQAIVVALLFLAYLQGWPQYLYSTDITSLTIVISILAIFGVACVALHKDTTVEYLIQALPRFGLFGTVVGLVMVSAAAGNNVQGMVDGLSTAFNTTIAGLIGAEWIRITSQLTR